MRKAGCLKRRRRDPMPSRVRDNTSCWQDEWRRMVRNFVGCVMWGVQARWACPGLSARPARAKLTNQRYRLEFLRRAHIACWLVQGSCSAGSAREWCRITLSWPSTCATSTVRSLLVAPLQGPVEVSLSAWQTY
jgi:hypothetical protein